MVSGIIFKTLICFELIFVIGIRKIVVQFHFLACDCLVFPMLFIKETVLSPTIYSRLLCSEFIDQISMVLLLGSTFYSIDLCVSFYANTIVCHPVVHGYSLHVLRVLIKVIDSNVFAIHHFLGLSINCLSSIN